jgi:hypothetical protein
MDEEKLKLAGCNNRVQMHAEVKVKVKVRVLKCSSQL